MGIGPVIGKRNLNGLKARGEGRYHTGSDRFKRVPVHGSQEQKTGGVSVGFVVGRCQTQTLHHRQCACCHGEACIEFVEVEILGLGVVVYGLVHLFIVR